MTYLLLYCLVAQAQSRQVQIDATRLTQTPVLSPGQDWQSKGVFNATAIKIGQVPNVIFLEGVAAQRLRKAAASVDLTAYYGAADTNIGAARLRIEVR